MRWSIELFFLIFVLFIFLIGRSPWLSQLCRDPSNGRTVLDSTSADVSHADWVWTWLPHLLAITSDGVSTSTLHGQRRGVVRAAPSYKCVLNLHTRNLEPLFFLSLQNQTLALSARVVRAALSHNCVLNMHSFEPLFFLRLQRKSLALSARAKYFKPSSVSPASFPMFPPMIWFSDFTRNGGLSLIIRFLHSFSFYSHR